jgi:signal transduction histidine kinase
MDVRTASMAQDLADRLPLGICTFASDDRLIYANPMALALVHFPLVLHQTRQQVVDRFGSGHAGLMTLAEKEKMVVPAGSKLLEVENQIMADGNRLWMISDISSELRLRAQLAEEASFLAHSHEAFMVIDAAGIIRYANEFCERERGFTAGSMVGLELCALERWSDTSYDLSQAISAEEMRQRLAEVVRGGRLLRYNAWHRHRDEGEHPVEVTMRAHRLSHEVVILTTAHDDSRRLMHFQALAHAKAEAESANRAKSAFMAITSHELRTPLTGIIGFCELLQLERDDAPPQTQKYLQLIAESSHSLLAIINDILDFSKIESRSLEIRPVRVDVEKVMDMTVRIWQERAGARHLVLQRRASSGPVAGIVCDPLRLRQMLDNLLSNAVKFTERGSIEVAVTYQPEAVEFAIIDTGCGIDEQARPSLFQAFWQAANATTRAAGGAGLGLYITRNLAEMLGGAVWLQRSGPQGSEFRLRLPMVCTGRFNARVRTSGFWIKSPRPLPG